LLLDIFGDNLFDSRLMLDGFVAVDVWRIHRRNVLFCFYSTDSIRRKKNGEKTTMAFQLLYFQLTGIN
jgi:hypothetical protein